MAIKKYFAALLCGSLFFITSCRNDDPKESTTPETEASNEANKFVWKAMNSWYYWQKEVPNLSDNFNYQNFIKGKTPDKLFYSLLKSTDGFSWIENNNEIVSRGLSVEVQKHTGIDFSLYPKDKSGTVYVAMVNYVVPGSSAATAGLKRGDVITKVNGANLTLNNYMILDINQFAITRAATSNVSVVDGYYQLTTTDRNESVNINKTDIDENPIAFYKRFDLAGKKIGYLVFNGFKIDYNDELNAQFAKMKSEGITDLILDFRYNGGGSLSTALGLAQMINGNFTNQDYIYADYNDKHNQYDGYEKLSDKLPIYNVVNGHPEQTGTQQINSLSLNKIYVLTSFPTASASELTIYALRKFIDVKTLGYYTVGKFVGSQTLYDSPDTDYISYEKRNKNHNWQLQPITFAYYNRNRDPHPTAVLNGKTEETIAPNFPISPYMAFNNIKEFGETSDPELKEALKQITGISTLREASPMPMLNYDLKLLAPKDKVRPLLVDDFYLNKRKK